MSSDLEIPKFDQDHVQRGRDIYDLCSAISKEIMKRRQVKLGSIGLSAGTAGFIRVVGDREDLTLSDVARALRVETATLSSLAVRMERDRLLIRQPSPKDKRAMLLCLTPRARELGQQAELIANMDLADVTYGLSDSEQSQLVRSLQHVLQNFDDLSL
ncbi:MarR family winged helix-turn-helix transcriptional regulator [Shimia sp. FJ5]|uniref:MarR family winged helix-turn-helix transcriptional regulator n=1 Tax=Shimia sp. FJ5 TaxID=3079054 RepID=UPI00293DFA3E|nr:MarR family transcriptional regulator [Shimia sp. FJ5]MDV4146655.1 MarR family transcriptional regulator [Shimia sp. FJ5]